jgi:hypothetical protein
MEDKKLSVRVNEETLEKELNVPKIIKEDSQEPLAVFNDQNLEQNSRTSA